MGHEAWQMIGRTPGYIVAVRPLRGGAITDFEITQRLIRLLFQRAGISRLQRARVLICVPSAITHVEQRAVLEAARRAGAAQTYLIEQPMAAAIGASLPIHEPLGNMVVDIGGGTSEVAVISLGGVVALEAVRVGSFDIDAAIQSYVRREYGIAIGERTAEEIKLAIGSAFPTDDEYKAEVRGRDLMSGLPKTVVLDARGGPRGDRRADPGDPRRGEAGPRAHAARARAGPPRRGHPPRRRRRDAAGLRPAHRAGDGGAACSSSTCRSRRSCSAPAAASRASTASRTCSCSTPARRGVYGDGRGRRVGVARDGPAVERVVATDAPARDVADVVVRDPGGAAARQRVRGRQRRGLRPVARRVRRPARRTRPDRASASSTTTRVSRAA